MNRIISFVTFMYVTFIINFFLQAYLQYLTTTEQLHKLYEHLAESLKTDDRIKVCNVTSTEPESPFIDSLLNSEIFPEGVIMIYNHCLPLRVNKSNLALACNTTNTVASLNTSSNESLGVSFGTFLHVRRGPSMVIYFHVTSADDLLVHLKHHLQNNEHVLSRKNDANIELMFPSNLPMEELKQGVSPYIGANVTYKEVPREAVIIVEQPI